VQEILIVDDHPMVAEAMNSWLNQRYQDVAVKIVHSAEDARAALASGTRWFRIFLDLDIPGAYGMSMGKEIQDLGMANICCVVSAANLCDKIQAAQALGMLGYIIKASPYEEFNASVDAIMAGQTWFASPTCDADPVVRLTPRQLQLLDAVRMGFSSKEIAQKYSLSEGTVNNAISAVMRALDVESRSQAVARAIEIGLLTAR
jgi:DNA-binding NarL/FixJ family response regulator